MMMMCVAWKSSVIVFSANTRPLVLLFLLLLACNCINTQKTRDSFSSSSSSSQGVSAANMVEDEKSRLGSTPPSCHNKCNECHPCTAVQVPSMPRRPVSYSDYNNNYKPLGWKCRCAHHLFNP